MKDKLRELAERWRRYADDEDSQPEKEGAYIESMRICAAELLAILDAEDDGGAVEGLHEYDRVNVADAKNEGARIVGFRIREGDYAWGKYGLSEPLEWLRKVTSHHPARSGVVSDEDVRDAERYRWLRAQGFDVPADIWVTTVKGNIPIVHSDLDEVIDSAIKGQRHER